MGTTRRNLDELANNKFCSRISFSKGCTYGKMIDSLRYVTQISLLVRNETETKLFLRESNVPTDGIRFYSNISYYDIWMRDFVSNFCISETADLKYVDIAFNFWGYERHVVKDLDIFVREYVNVNKAIGKSIAKSIGAEILPFSGLFDEGGDRSVNGMGSLLVSEIVKKDRNPSMSLEEIDERLRMSLEVSKIVFLGEGGVEDRATFKGKLPGPPENLFTSGVPGGHVDEFARFVGNEVVLLSEMTEMEAMVHEINAKTRENLEKNLGILKSAGFDVVRIPCAPLMMKMIGKGDQTFELLRGLVYEDGTEINENQNVTIVLASSYMNYVVSNGLILLPKYADSDPGLFYNMSVEEVVQKDDEAERVMKKVFPGFQVKRINPTGLNFGGGGMHCVTTHQPSLETSCTPKHAK